MRWLILQRLKSGNPEKRRQAVESLAKLGGSRVLDRLAEAFTDKDAQVRAAVVAALAEIPGTRSMELLLRAFLDPAPQVRQAAVSHLKDDGSERLQSAMAGALRDADPGVRWHAARFLEKSGWRPRDLEDEIWLAIALGQMMRAASLGAAAIQPLESVFREGIYSQQAAVVEALGAIPDERVLKSLVSALRSPDIVVCMAAIEALSNAGDSGVVADLAKLFKHKDHRIRAAAIEAVSHLDAQNEQGGGLRELLRDALWDVRCAAATALAKVRDITTVEALAAALKDESTDVRSAAAASLGHIGDARAIGPLVLAVKDGETEVRKLATVALTQIDTHWAKSEAARNLAPELRGALGSGDWAVRRAAAHVLEQLGERQPGTLEPPRTEMASPVRRRQEAVLTVFTDLLKDEDGDLRLAAAESLGRLGDVRARSPLMTALTDMDQAVRLAAAQALADLGVE